MNSLDVLSQCGYEKVFAVFCFVDYIAVGQILFDLFCWKVMDNIQDNHITNCFGVSDAADKISDNLLTSKTVRAPIAAFIERRTCNRSP